MLLKNQLTFNLQHLPLSPLKWFSSNSSPRPTKRIQQKLFSVPTARGCTRASGTGKVTSQSVVGISANAGRRKSAKITDAAICAQCVENL
jgi:hypothetical protein